MDLSRRDLAKLTLSALPLARASASVNSVYQGVQFGICSYSFRGLGLDELIRQMTAVPMGQLELESVFVEPAAPAGSGRGQTPERREALRRWRLTVSLDEIRAIRRRLDEAGIDVYAFNIPVNDTFTEEELDRVFRIARLLGAQAVNSATTLPVVPILAAAAERHNMRVGLHPSGGPANADAIGSGDSYRKALAISPRIGANPDLNGWKAWGPDPLAFIREIGSRITTMHTHDSRPAEPRAMAVPFGEGTNPIVEVLGLMRNEKFTFAAMMERIYNLPEGGDNVTEIRKSLAYCKKALST
jgi:sugar phosphate isomerase/epimerase